MQKNIIHHLSPEPQEELCVLLKEKLNNSSCTYTANISDKIKGVFNNFQQFQGVLFWLSIDRRIYMREMTVKKHRRAVKKAYRQADKGIYTQNFLEDQILACANIANVLHNGRADYAMKPYGKEDYVFKAQLRRIWKQAVQDQPYLDQFLPNATDADLIVFFFVQLKHYNLDILNEENDIEEVRLAMPRYDMCAKIQTFSSKDGNVKHLYLEDPSSIVHVVGDERIDIYQKDNSELRFTTYATITAKFFSTR